jgi:hypothetical protein
MLQVNEELSLLLSIKLQEVIYVNQEKRVSHQSLACACGISLKFDGMLNYVAMHVELRPHYQHFKSITLVCKELWLWVEHC